MDLVAQDQFGMKKQSFVEIIVSENDKKFCDLLGLLKKLVCCSTLFRKQPHFLKNKYF